MRFVRFGRCPECKRIFDLENECDADEWYHGHDCEPAVLGSSHD